jgi:hypothetical protein
MIATQESDADLLKTLASIVFTNAEAAFSEARFSRRKTEEASARLSE